MRSFLCICIIRDLYIYNVTIRVYECEYFTFFYSIIPYNMAFLADIHKLLL